MGEHGRDALLVGYGKKALKAMCVTAALEVKKPLYFTDHETYLFSSHY